MNGQLALSATKHLCSQVLVPVFLDESHGYWERSPLSLPGRFNADHAVTGEEDWRTPMWESEQLYRR